MPNRSAPPPVAELQAVSKKRGSVLALDGLSLAIAPGQVTALLGPNGAGKTTAVGLLTGQFKPDQGRAVLFGGDPRESARRERMGVMLQDAGLPKQLTVAEQVDLFRGYYPAPRARADVLALAGLDGFEKRRCAALSGGQQRRLQFALAICGRPDLLLLDEPTTGMDVEARKALWMSVRAEADRGAAVLLTTHYLEEAEALADRIVVIGHGKLIADGSPDTIKSAAASTAIRCRTALADRRLAAMTGVASVGREGGRVALMTNAATATLRELLAADPDLQDISVTGASLEDAFTRLTGATAAAPNREKELAQ